MKKIMFLVMAGWLLLQPILWAQCLSEDFSSTWPPVGWTMLNGGSGNNWSLSSYAAYAYSPSYCMQYHYHSYQAGNAWAITPGIAMVAGNKYRIEFQQRVGSSSYREYLKITVGSAPTIAAQTTTLLDYPLPGLTNESYINRVAPEYTCTVSGTYYFGFKCYSPANMYYLYIDNVRVYETQVGTPPSSAAITQPPNNASNLLNNISLSWEPGSGSTNGYKLYLGTNNPPTNLLNGIDLGLIKNYTPASLNYNTQYFWKVVPYNNFGDAPNCPIWNFTTGADPTVLNYPFTETFEALQLTYGWQNRIGQGVVSWSFSPDLYQPAHTGNGMAEYNCIATNPADQCLLISPPLDMNGNTYNYKLSFWMWRDHYILTNDDQVLIYMNTRDDLMLAPTLVADMHRIIYSNPAEDGADGWYYYEMPLTPKTNGSSNYLIFKAYSQCGIRLCLDDIQITRYHYDTPTNVRIEKVGDQYRLVWDSLENVAGYNVWYTDDPSLPLDTQNPIGWFKTLNSPINNSYYEFTPTETRRFYRVTAVW